MKSVCLFVTIACLTAAQEPAARSTERSRVGTGVQDPVVDYYDSMSDYFRQSPRAIMAINRKGIPDQDIPALLLIARRSSASPNQIIAARKAGKQWDEIAKQYNVTLGGTDFVKEANVIFLSEYHGRPAGQIREMLDKDATYIAVNQELRRTGSGTKKTTERSAQP
jgi:hypothetical protein